MAKPRYNFIKQQKEQARQKKKAEKKQKRLDGSSDSEEHEDLQQAVADVRSRMQSMDPDSELYRMGESLIANLDDNPEDISLDMARLFLERTAESPEQTP